MGMSEKTSVDFGELVSVVVGEIGIVESELNIEELKDTSRANDHYKEAVANRLRRFFDEVEDRNRQEDIEIAARKNLQDQNLRQVFLRLLEDREFSDKIAKIQAATTA
jgi:hypothetical protein